MTIENDKVVGIEYQLTEDGQNEIIDSNKGGAPLEFIMGKGSIIPGLEKELVGLNEGDSKVVVVIPSEAYGEYDERGLQTYPKEQFEGIELQEGLTLFGQSEDGQTVQVHVKSFTDSEVTVDYNHPLAGKALSFDVTVVSVKDATEEELAAGVPASMMQQGGGCGCGSSEGDSCCGGEGHGHEHEGDHECCGGANHKDGEGCGCH